MTTSIDVINLALFDIGQGAIANVDQGGVPANTAKVTFPVVLRAMLSDNRWNFADRNISLQATPDAPIIDYALEYILPGGWVRVWKINGNAQVDWKIKEGRILTNEKSPILVEYSFFNEDPTTWGGSFTLACVKFLASFFAGSILHDSKLVQSKLQEYQLLIADARTIDSQQGFQDRVISTSLTSDIRD